MQMESIAIFINHAERKIDQINRRLFLGERIPHVEFFSLRLIIAVLTFLNCSADIAWIAFAHKKFFLGSF